MARFTIKGNPTKRQLVEQIYSYAISESFEAYKGQYATTEYDKAQSSIYAFRREFFELWQPCTRFIDNGNIWGHPHAAKAVCADGIVRKVRLNQSPDTFFSWSGRVTIKKLTVTGYVHADDSGELVFSAYMLGKNYDALNKKCEGKVVY